MQPAIDHLFLCFLPWNYNQKNPTHQMGTWKDADGKWIRLKLAENTVLGVFMWTWSQKSHLFAIKVYKQPLQDNNIKTFMPANSTIMQSSF